MACRFPGAADLQAFWHLLIGQRSGLRMLSDEALLAAGVAAEALRDPAYVKANGSLDDALCFDAGFFGYAPEEAALIDPQHRVFLEACWHAREDAIGTRADDERIGVYGGSGFNTYLLTHLQADARTWQGLDRWRAGIANDKDTLTSRVAYKLGFSGPAVTVQTACSTSLVAVHLACQAILDGDCELALAGGASVHFPLGHGYRHHAEGIEAADGVCRPFSAEATGTVFSDGVGVVALRRYEDARRAGDRVYAVIRGSAINNDAADKVGFTAPGMRGQIDVIRMAHAVAGVTGGAIDYVEAHGTGTAVGDSIELQALERAFGSPGAPRTPCLIGAVKGNIGHTDNAAGIAGLIKVALALHHRQWPSTLHAAAPTPALASSANFALCRQAAAWSDDIRLRCAGVSSFGIGGTNAHVVVQQAFRSQAGAGWASGHPFRRTHVEYLPRGQQVSEAGPQVHLTHLQWVADPRRRHAAGQSIDRILLVAATAPPAALLRSLGALGPVDLWLHAQADAASASACFDFTDAAQWDRLAMARGHSQPPSAIVYLGGLAQAPAGFDDTLGCALGFAGWVARMRGSGALPGVAVHWISTGLSGANGSPSIPAHLALWGPARVLPQEVPGVACRVYDVHEGSRPRDGDAWQALGRLIAIEQAAERPADGSFAVFALQGDRIFVPHPAAVAQPSAQAEAPALRTGGTYFVTGGAGGIGRELAAWLVSRCRARVIVCGRRPVNDVQGWSAFHAQFPSITYVQADVESDAQLAAIAQDAGLAPDGIHGVFHCAGAAGEGGLRAKDVAAARRRCAAKVAGAQALCCVFADVPLDFMVFFSSVNGWLGGPGQAEYCSANASLDALARSGALPWRTLSIAWDTWLDTGMARRSQDAADPSAPATGAHEAGVSFHLPASSWLLHEHRVDGVAVLPGTAHLALLLQVAQAEGRALELQGVRLLNPALVREGSDMRLSVSRPTAADEAFQVRDASGLVLASATAAAHADEAASVALPSHLAGFSATQAQACEIRPPARLQVGQRWQGVESLSRCGELYRVALRTGALAQDFGEWPWHPAVMDLALLPLQTQAAAFSVPVAFERVQPVASLATARFSYVRLREGAASRGIADVCITDAHDAVLLTMSGVAFVPLEARALRQRAVTDEALSRGLPVPAALEQLGRLLDGCALDAVILSAASLPLIEEHAEASARRYRGVATRPAEATGQDAAAREALLCRLVAGHLGYDTVSPDANFFSLGGDSLSGLLLIESACKEGLQLSLGALYDAKTLAELARTAAPEAAVQAVPAPRAEPFALLCDEDRARVAEEVAGAVDAFPLSALQKGVAYYRSRYGDRPIYRDLLWVDVEGPFDEALLRQAWSDCARRHPVLRTRVDTARFREPLQIVSADDEAPLAVGDLAGRGVREWAEASDLPARCPVGRAVYLFALTDGAVLHLLLLLDDALLDGWSATSLLAELLGNYGQRLDGGLPPRQPSPALSFHDHVRHERQVIAAGEEHRFWREHLDGCVPSALTRKAPDARERVPEIEIRELPFGASGEVDALARTCGATPKVVLLGSYLRALSLWCGSHEVTTGLETHTRLEAEGGAEVLGPHLNMLPLRQLFAPMPVRSYLLALARAEAQAIAHRHLPLSEIQRDWAVPLFDNCFNYTHFRKLQEVAGDGGLGRSLRFKGYAGEEKTHYPFKLWVDCSAAGIYRLYIAYDRLRIDEADARAIAALFDTVAQAFAWAPDADLMSVGAPSGAQGALRAVEATPELGELFRASWQAHAHRTAVREADRCFSYRELSFEVERSARELRRRGCRPGMTVAVVLPRSFRWIVAMLGVLKAGATILPIDPYLPDARIEMMLRQGRPLLVVADAAMQSERLKAWRGPMLAPLEDAAFDAELAGPWAASADLPAYLIFTSGSMGLPKGVINTCRGLANRFVWQLRSHPVGPDDVFLSRTPASFADVFWESFGPLCAGATLVIADDAESRDPARIAQLLRRWQVTHLVVVPTLLEPVLAQIEADAGNGPFALRQVSVSGEPLKVALMARARALLPSVRWLNLYGSSEVSADVSVFELGDWQARPDEPSIVPAGAALRNIGLHLLDENLQPVREGCTGELYVSGVALADGYLRQPGLTAARFLPNPWPQGDDDTRMFRTGDVARQGRCGLEVLGRADRQVKVRGVRIDLGDLETRLERLAPVARAALIEGGGKLAAYVQCRPEADPAQLWPVLRAQLLPEERPVQIWLVERMPLTTAGKIDRLALAGTGVLHSDLARAALQGETEHRLAGLWAELLPGANIHADSHFDELGGHSLLALQLAGGIERVFGRRLGIAQLQATGQLRAQARLVDAQHAAAPVAHAPIVPDPAAQSLPFSPTPLQQAYWVARHRESPEGGSSHLYQEWLIPGLDADRLEAAWRRVVARHGMLRARIDANGLFTVRDANPSGRIVRHDLSSLAPPAREAALLASRERHAFTPFADGEALFQLQVFQLAQAESVLAVKFDLLLADAWSMGILARELWTLYADPAAELPPLGISFRDVLEHTRAHHDAAAREVARRYWSERMARFPGAPELPVRAHAPDTLAVRRREMVLEPSRRQALEALAARAGLPASSLLLAAFAAVLQRWSARKAFALTLTLFDRPFVHPQVNHVVGDFTSVLWLAIDGERPGAFLAFARALHARLLEGLEHRAFNGIDVARATRSELRAVDAMRYVFTHIAEVDGGAAAFPPGSSERHRITRTAGVWIDSQAVGEAGRLRLHWDAVDERFPPGLVDDMFAAYRDLLEALLAEAQAEGGGAAEAVELQLPAAQQARRQAERQADPPAQDYLAAIEAQCSEAPDAPAVIAADRTLSYGELWARARRLALQLKTQAPDAACVAIHLEPGWRYVVAVLATQIAGLAYVPLSLRWPRARVAGVIESYGIGHAIADEELAAWSPRPGGVRTLRVPAQDDGPAPPASMQSASDPSLLAYVMFTSGSTGEPKGVTMRRGAVANTLRDICARLRLNRDSRVLGLSDPGFDLSVFDMLGTLMAGGALVLPDPADRMNPQAWWALCRRHGVTVWNSAPALFEMLADYARGKTGRLGTLGLRWVMLSGDWIALHLPARLRELAPGARLLSLGGATEAGIWSVSFPVTAVQPGWTRIPYGMPLRGQRCDIVDAFGQSCPDGVAGELTIAGASLSDGYWQRPLLTAQAFVTDERTGERRYRTGDLARWRPDGVIELIGRIDSQVKIAGHRIECQEVEHAVLSHPGVARAVVVPVDGSGGLALHAVLEHADDVSIESIRLHCAQRLPEAMVPRHWHSRLGIPLNDNGKIDRRALRERIEATLQEVAGA
ncbi:amino acid adenylation domain-containing protein [Variovorax boronicumulans]|uniref:amino acid adenylation domain-containing protein n=1 Tax=Variovorax boronicumulans TaxID=436515 RepID=UPI00348E0FB0